MTRLSERYPTTRKAALSAGERFYLSDRLCKHGHLSIRYAYSGSCYMCRILAEKAKAAARPKHVWKGRDRENSRRLSREHYERNREQYLARIASWQQENPERRRATTAKWARDNPKKILASVRKRQAAKIQRTPAWADIRAIERFYMNCPPGHQVDHVIPLRGDLVSGLHVLNNLQYLPKIENAKKGNQFDPWTFEA